jgi:hypothetical protein
MVLPAVQVPAWFFSSFYQCVISRCTGGCLIRVSQDFNNPVARNDDVKYPETSLHSFTYCDDAVIPAALRCAYSDGLASGKSSR